MPTIKPKRHHGFGVVLFILGTLFPPLAVAARFGIGSDFWLNLVLTLAGYIPGHVHNFYIQNIRNNKNHRRTPKWAQRYGLVDTSTIKRKERRSQWASRYDERLPSSTLNDQPLEEGQNPEASNVSLSSESAPSRRRAGNGELWNAQEEQFYGQSNGSGESRSSRWHYPANFDGATASPALGSSAPKKKKKIKKDRFARTEDAYSITENTTRRKKKRSNRTAVDDESTHSRGSESTGQVPEDPEGIQYGSSSRERQTVVQDTGTGTGGARADDDTVFDHQF
ncbi:hypothetical protein EDB92DRAFT_1963716 [Lactarius akahatsu]|uniref:Uncharacterized protein n=1 Tax=Lactarius akahatsu TaxID=416441 RepID=A0AAD4LSU9_9AGAM|nr:hypothetical protein EDB92DRAFT_1963716 [Lactarius akahatsu]